MEEGKIVSSYMNKDKSLDLTRIVNDYTNYVFMIIRNMTKEVLTNEDIEEIISDVFLVVWKNKDKLEMNLPLKPYIAGVSKNIIKNRLRSLKITDELDENFDKPSNDDVSELVESKEVNNIIIHELDKNPDDKKIFIMFYYEGKKSKEIADILGYTEFNVSTKLHRIRKRLKDVLEKRGYSYGK